MPSYGQVFDHFATEYEYENGVKMTSMCRQIDGTASRVSEQIVGTKGTSNCNTSIKGENPWRWDGERPNSYVEEHRHLFEAMESGVRINEGKEMAERHPYGDHGQDGGLYGPGNHLGDGSEFVGKLGSDERGIRRPADRSHRNPWRDEAGLRSLVVGCWRVPNHPTTQ